MRILLVEDDKSLAFGLITTLKRESLSVEHLTSGLEAVHALSGDSFDLCILDLTLPDLDGLDVIVRVRSTGCLTPILILSARDSVGDRIEGLSKGADDYLIKPFDTRELMARIIALQRRQTGRVTNLISYKSLNMDIRTMQVSYNGDMIELQPNEFKILRKLVQSPSVIFSKAQLEEHLYGWDGGVDSNTINVYIHGIRKKTSNDLIRTIRGIGYKIA